MTCLYLVMASLKPKNWNYQHMLAYYTCFMGASYNPDIAQPNWSYVSPPTPPSMAHDCYFFTNNKEMYAALGGTGWKRVWMDVPVYGDSILDRMSSKELRTCPHRFPELTKYEWLCWFDNKLRVDHAVVNDLITNTSKSLILSKHPHQFPTVWGEFELAMGYAHYAEQREQNLAYIRKRLAEGASEQLPAHYCGGFHVRRQTDPRVTAFGEEWLRHIQECGIEDQISLQFVHQAFTDIIHPVPYQFGWTYK